MSRVRSASPTNLGLETLTGQGRRYLLLALCGALQYNVGPQYCIGQHDEVSDGGPRATKLLLAAPGLPTNG
jgi:hypothetical protein